MLVALPLVTGLFSVFSYDPPQLRAISAAVAMDLIVAVARAGARVAQSVV